MGIYLGQEKIGYSSLFINKADFQGKPGYRIDSSGLMRVLVRGENVEQNLESTSYLDEDFGPMRETFKMSSAGHTTTVTASFSPDEIVAEVESGGTKSTKRIPIPPGSRMFGDGSVSPTAMELKVGDKLDLKFFEPVSVRLDEARIEVLRKEDIELHGRKYEALVIRSRTSLGETTYWHDEKGNLLKSVSGIMGVGMTMIREPKEKAQSLRTDGAYTPPPDLAVMTVCPANIEIPKPRQVTYMKVRLIGLADKALVINDHRQKATFSNGSKPAAVYEITASDFDPAKAASLPIKTAGMEEFLAESPYVQSANAEIAEAAKQIIGDEKNARAAVSRLRAWVNSNMQTRGDIGILRSSVDILHAKNGVCRDFALLYTALARAAGIPTKFVTGLMYLEGGFYYHAWAESFVGEWIPVDPTLSTDFVDATHIKLAEGDTTAMFDVVKAVGTLKAEIIGFE